MTSLVTVYIPEFYWRRFLSLHMYYQNWAWTTQIAQLLLTQKGRTHPSNALSSFFFSIDCLKCPLFFLRIGCAILTKTFHTFLARNSPVENSTGDVMTFG